MLSIVLVNWNGWADTLSCVSSILNSKSAPYRIIIVDNMSSNLSMEAFERWSTGDLELLHPANPVERLSAAGAQRPRMVKFGRYVEKRGSFEGFEDREFNDCDTGNIYVVVSGRNGGFGFGCNVGMRLADHLGSDSYWLLNNDCIVSADAVSLVSDAVRSRPETAFGTIVRYYDRPEVIQCVGGGDLSKLTGKNRMRTTKSSHQPLDYLYGASTVFSRQFRVAVGDFDEKIFMYYEEIDLCIRARKAGFSFDVVDADVYHRHGGSQGGVSVSAWRYVMINKWYVLNKHFGFGPWMLTFAASLLVRCLNPFGAPSARLGARQALLTLVTKESV